jgi:3,4-dihydroxy 2-butanone 4-phosphate synthase/GTP cyclohydrolase II
VRRVSAAQIPTEWGPFQAVAYESLVDGEQHLALVRGRPAGRPAVLVRVHSECLTGDVFGSRRCDCGAQLREAMGAIAREGVGVVVYLRGQEGRGIGLGHKLRAYGLQDLGHDTVDANLALGLPVDDREYGIGAQILADLGVTTMRLMTNNPAKYTGLEGFGLTILERVPMPPVVTAENRRYLQAKRQRLGHLIDVSPTISGIGPTTPGIGPTTPGIGPTIPDVSPTIPDDSPTIPDVSPTIPDVSPLTPA